MNTSHTIRAHAQEVSDRSDKIKGGCQSERKLVPHDSKSDLPLDDGGNVSETGRPENIEAS